MITFEDLKKANDSIKTTDIKGKEYAEVNQRIKAFRMVYPEGVIMTEMVINENGVCIFKATVGTYQTNEDDSFDMASDLKVLGTGTAYEKENSTFINKTSYIENCETSAVGRALGMAGFGIDTSVASFEEVANAIEQQNSQTTINKNMETVIRKLIEDHQIPNERVKGTLNTYGYKKLTDIQVKDFKTILEELS